MSQEKTRALSFKTSLFLSLFSIFSTATNKKEKTSKICCLVFEREKSRETDKLSKMNVSIDSSSVASTIKTMEDMEISAPPASYNNNSQMMTSRIKSFFFHTNSQQPTISASSPAFAVPNDFDTTSQKGFKSNSWFSTAADSGTKSQITLGSNLKHVLVEDKSIRRVASAPNAAKLLNTTKQQQSIFLNNNSNNSGISIPSTIMTTSTTDSPPLQRLRTCRRTYSSSSIKVKKVEVGPSSFVKIRMLGKGDVGKVYMVKQKETDKLFAMKGLFFAKRCVSEGD